MDISKPVQGEYKPYFQRYLDLVGEGMFSELFEKGTQFFISAAREFPAEKENFSYAPGKWTVKQLIQHVTDTDRVFAYRAMVAARKDVKTVLNVVDEDLYAANAPVDKCSMKDLILEFESHRLSFLKMVQKLDTEKSSFCVQVDGFPVSARAMAYVSIGHCIHHANILRERYL
jgi:hypothetical protein